jgi:hypothetical protein
MLLLAALTFSAILVAAYGYGYAIRSHNMADVVLGLCLCLFAGATALIGPILIVSAIIAR